MTTSPQLTFPCSINHGILIVYDAQGTKVWTDNVSGTSYLLKRNHLVKGVYMIQITDEKGEIFNTKLSVQ